MTLTLRVHTEPARDGDAAARGAGAPAAHVLVVDDVAQNRSALERWLANLGHDVALAENGRIALDMTAIHHYDLVLLDVEMPELNGYEVLQRLKGASATRDIPVIMISALDELRTVALCIEAGAEDYLQKPFQPVLLAARIGASLEKKRLRDAEVDYMRQVASVIEAAQALEEGAYVPGSLGGVAVRSDELGRLARVFDTMATVVWEREERMQGRIEALQAEIGAHPRAALSAHDSHTLTRRVGDLSDAAAMTRRIGGASDVRAPGSEPVPDQRAGTVFARRFEILSRIGSGGMGVVYRAHDRDLDEDVAIKLLDPDLLSEDDGAIERFKTEIRLARQISSPHVVRTHDFGEWMGTYYLTMEYVVGITVRQLIERRGKLAPPAVLAIATQLANALDSAHRQHVIHRDIKPENLLLDPAGVLKVMDFGIARLAQTSHLATKAGMILGTPAYMSPEQLVGDQLDGRSDLYATGVVLYECLTGRHPIAADNLFQLVARVFEEQPVAPATVDTGIPSAFSALVLRLLSKRRENRPSSAAELRDLLAALA
jgi:CheY-like chemotaxis protein